jgi:L-fucose isomerase-like protein
MTFGLIVGTKGFFNPQLAREARMQLLAKLDSLGYSYVILPETATVHGAMETLADARKCAGLFQQHRARICRVVRGLRHARVGGIAVYQVGRLRELLAHLCQNGFEHHVAMVRTHCATVLHEAVSKCLGWDLDRHE